MSATTNTKDELAALIAEGMKANGYDDTDERRHRSAGLLAEDLLETQYEVEHIEEAITRLKEHAYSRRRGYINYVHQYGVTTRQIGEAMGLSHQRVAQILQEPNNW